LYSFHKFKYIYIIKIIIFVYFLEGRIMDILLNFGNIKYIRHSQKRHITLGWRLASVHYKACLEHLYQQTKGTKVLEHYSLAL